MKMKILFVVCVVALAAAAASGEEPSFSGNYFSMYRGAQVWRVDCSSAAACTQLRLLASSLQLDEWHFEQAAGDGRPGFIDVLVPAQRLPECTSALLGAFRLSPLIADVEQQLIAQLASRTGAGNVSSPMSTAGSKAGVDPAFFLSYHTYGEIVEFMSSYATAYPQFVTMFELGTTVENRSILGLRIANDGLLASLPPAKREIFFNSLIHAREWISGATLTYLIDFLVDTIANGQGDSDVEQFAWTVVPVLNVDGYMWSWSNDRMWRKNRRRNGLCYGVDNNRNFPYQWGITKNGESSSVACADSYHGPAPASEPETQALIGWWADNVDHIAAYFDIHAYGQYWLTPWGYTATPPPRRDYDRQNGCSTQAVDAIYQFDRRVYQNGGGATLYATSGDTTDTSYGQFGIVYSQTIELRGAATGNGFLLPPSQIIPQGQEFVVGVLAAIEYILAYPA